MKRTLITLAITAAIALTPTAANAAWPTPPTPPRFADAPTCNQAIVRTVKVIHRHGHTIRRVTVVRVSKCGVKGA